MDDGQCFRVLRHHVLDVLHRPVLTAGKVLRCGEDGQHGELGGVRIQVPLFQHGIQQRRNKILPADAVIRVQIGQHILQQAGGLGRLRQEAGIQQVNIIGSGQFNQQAVQLRLTAVDDGADLDAVLRVGIVEADDGVHHLLRAGEAAVLVLVHLTAAVTKAGQDQRLFHRHHALRHLDHTLAHGIENFSPGVFQPEPTAHGSVAEGHIQPVEKRTVLPGGWVIDEELLFLRMQETTGIAAELAVNLGADVRSELEGS